jgi:mRNA interferase MazF
MRGKFVLVPFPFTDLTISKLRPALVLYEGKRDVVVAFVSSRIPDKTPEPSIKIPKAHDEFKLSGLKVSSIIRIDKLATILKDMVVGELGDTGPNLKDEINKKIRDVYRL